MKEDDAISRQAVHETIERWAGSMNILVILPPREVEPLLNSIHDLPPVTPKAEPQDLYRVIEDIKEEIKDLDYLVNDAKYSDAETRVHNVDYLMYEIYKILDRHKATRK